MNIGMYSKHCTQCTGLGKCIGFHHELHCNKCHNHYNSNELDTLLCSDCCDVSHYNRQYYCS